jgi:preprotein translocase subunit SecA
VYRTEREKFDAVVQEITECHERGQPVLVGTISIEKSERLSGMLKKKGVKHSVLNAKYHEKEAEIIAQAGRKDGVTIATNMAGRGTDILLGGNPDFLFKRELIQQPEMPADLQKRLADQIKSECDAEKQQVVALGGLHIIASERHESRRIDNQLRGRAGRQGDPGSTRFYLSLEDDLMRIFGSDRISGLMQRLGMEEGVPIEHRMVTRAIENAQKKVEGHHFDVRKQLLEYDDVMNKQRTIIYEQRRQVLRGEKLSDMFQEMIAELVEDQIALFCPAETYAEDWDVKGLLESVHRQFGVAPGEAELKDLGAEAVGELILNRALEAYKKKESDLGDPIMRQLEKMVMLRVMDTHWKDHLLAMDYLKEGIGLRGYGQKDPLVEYKMEGFDMFAAMIKRVKSDAIDHLFRLQLVREAQPSAMLRAASRAPLTFSRGETAGGGAMTGVGGTPTDARGLSEGGGAPAGSRGLRPPGPPAVAQPVHRDPKVGRNDPCPCGSGKKYKKCHGT